MTVEVMEANEREAIVHGARLLRGGGGAARRERGRGVGRAGRVARPGERGEDSGRRARDPAAAPRLPRSLPRRPPGRAAVGAARALSARPRVACIAARGAITAAITVRGIRTG